MSRLTLVVMAAGMASRYGGNKQVEGMGPHGEILMEYSIHDAIRAGFDRVVFVIKSGMEPLMRRLCGDRFAQQIEVCYAVQSFEDVPSFYKLPAERVKPLGTVHAVLAARQYIDSPFAVINADDYYGVSPYGAMAEFLQNAKRGEAAMMGYRLRNTVSPSGTVTRGLCRIENGALAGVREAHDIRLLPNGVIEEQSDPSAAEVLDPDVMVSMNFWGFAPEILDDLQAYFENFLHKLSPDEIKAECLLPVAVDELIRGGRLTVRVLPTDAVWFGVTYKEDRPGVVKALAELHAKGVYK